MAGGQAIAAEASRDLRRSSADALLVGVVVFAACVFGSATRPAGLLAAIWPANALLLGLMVRNPRLSTVPCWLAAVLGYVAADFAFGSVIQTALLLTSGNMAGVAVGHGLLSRLHADDKYLRRPSSMLKLGLLAAVASVAAACCGAVMEPILFGGTLLGGWSFWFASELVNYIALLPVVLTVPWKRLSVWCREADLRLVAWRVLPVAALVASSALSVFIGGPGAIAFPVPALLWCALAYTMPTVAVLTLLFCAWTMIGISAGIFPVDPDFNSRHSLLSIRLGVTLIALAPLTLASVMIERNELLARFRHLATHDPLTGALSRGAFTERGEALVDEGGARLGATALLVLDIDYFKRINDTYGHAVGDRVLVLFAETTRRCLRESDLFGRTGGEEFAILLPDCGRAAAESIAERIRGAFAQARTAIDGGQAVAATVSVGLASAEAGAVSLESLLWHGDKALYRAKAAGRNRVELAEIAVGA